MFTNLAIERGPHIVASSLPERQWRRMSSKRPGEGIGIRSFQMGYLSNAASAYH